LQLKQDKMENFKIISEKINPLFERREIQATINSESTPSKEEVKKFLTEKLSVSEDVLKLENIKGRFGSNEFIITAKVYKTSEHRNSIERKTKKEIEVEKKEIEEVAKAESEKKKAEQEAVQKEAEEKLEEIKEEPEKVEEKPVEELKEEAKE